MKILFVLLMTVLVLAQAPAAGPASTARMPNRNLTPGVARTTNAKEICAQSFTTKDYRHVTEAQKNQVFEDYKVTNHTGYCGKAGCEIDHLISLELGGANDAANLWPQPYGEHPGAHEKDKLENFLHRQVCSGKMTLPEAQKAIATDWYAAYQTMPHPKPKKANE